MYTVISRKNLQDFNECLDNSARDGFTPYGNLETQNIGGCISYSLLMFKPDPPPPSTKYDQAKLLARSVLTEREKQIDKGNDAASDFANNKEGQLLTAVMRLTGASTRTNPPTGWDEKRWKRLMAKPIKGRLIIASAMILAHMEAREYGEALK